MKVVCTIANIPPNKIGKNILKYAVAIALNRSIKKIERSRGKNTV